MAHVNNPFTNPTSVKDFYNSLVCVDEIRDCVRPWRGYEGRGWVEAVERVAAFLKAMGSRASWASFNGTVFNEGAMSMNAAAGNALIERYTNVIDTVLDLAVSKAGGETPKSPSEAAEKHFGIGPHSLSYEMTEDEVRKIAKSTGFVRSFTKMSKEPDDHDMIHDIRDYGMGIAPEDMRTTILASQRGHKANKDWQIGIHGLGASNTYQFCKLTVIASKKEGTDVVGMTVVRQQWDNASGVFTYQYLLIDGQIMTLIVKDDMSSTSFRHGTLVRHIGYVCQYDGRQGEYSVFGLFQRMLAKSVLPVWTVLHEGRPSKGGGRDVPPFHGHGHVVRGSINALERARYFTMNGDARPKANHRQADVPHSHSTTFKLGSKPFLDLDTGKLQEEDLGEVVFRWFVTSNTKITRKGDESDRPATDAIKNLADPLRPIHFTLDGQTHAEEQRQYITADKFAGLDAVGKYMVVQVDCTGLTMRGRYELFPSTRERLKECALKDEIIRELIRRLKIDTTLEALNVEYSGVSKTTADEDNLSYAKAFQEYCKDSGINLDKLTQKVLKERIYEEERDRPGPGRKKKEPIPASKVPTILRWAIQRDFVQMWPGQRYGWTLETDIPANLWDPSGQLPKSRINISTNGSSVRFLGGDELVGGRVRCHFECSETAKPGDEDLIQVVFHPQVASMSTLTCCLSVRVVERTEPNPRPPGTPHPDGTNGKEKIQRTREEEVEHSVDIVEPKGITPEDPAWNVQFGVNVVEAGYRVRRRNGQIQIYYNALHPFFVDCKKRLAKKNLGDFYETRFKYKLVIHAANELNNELIDLEELKPEVALKHHCLLATMLGTMALDTKIEVEQERELNAFKASIDDDVHLRKRKASATAD